MVFELQLLITLGINEKSLAFVVVLSHVLLFSLGQESNTLSSNHFLNQSPCSSHNEGHLKKVEDVTQEKRERG